MVQKYTILYFLKQKYFFIDFFLNRKKICLNANYLHLLEKNHGFRPKKRYFFKLKFKNQLTCAFFSYFRIPISSNGNMTFLIIAKKLIKNEKSINMRFF